MEYIISVIIPAYNAENTIVRCLDSIMKQSVESLEIICVDDGSSDNTLNILRNYQKAHEHDDNRHITVITQKNTGASRARNHGLEKACGKYIAFVDSDDMIHQNMYAELIKIAEDYQLDVVMCNIMNYYENGKIQKSEEQVPVNQILHKEDILHLICPTLMREEIFGGPCNRIYRRNFIQKFHIRMPEDLSYAEDAVFQMQVFDNLNETWFSSEAYYCYMHRSDSSSCEKPGRFMNTLAPLYQIRIPYAQKWKIDMLSVNNHFIYCTIMDIFCVIKSRHFNNKLHYLKEVIHSEFLHQALQKSHIEITQYTWKIFIMYKILKFYNMIKIKLPNK